MKGIGEVDHGHASCCNAAILLEYVLEALPRSHMELYQLRSFAAVAELGHLTRAADKLHISQPALSAQIKALEDELGVALFDRTSSGMTLTAGGQRLLTEAGKVLAAAGALSSQARAIA